MAAAGDKETETLPAQAGDVACIVLAAGKSTRMRSKTPKTLHPVCGLPLIAHILDALENASVHRRVVVVGHQADVVRNTLDARYSGGDGTLEYALQAEQKGTGHAVQQAEPLLSTHNGTVLVVPGDAPLLTSDALRALIATHLATGAGATLLTAVLPTDAGAYGRVLRDADGSVLSIVEAKDATPEQLALREINTSVYAFQGTSLFRALRDLRPNNVQGELYLTDVIALLREAGQKIGAVIAPDPDMVLGVNTRVELAEVNEKMRRRLLRDLMLGGVTVVDPATTYMDAGVTVGQDSVIHPHTILRGDTCIGEDCIIGPYAHIESARIGNAVVARACFIEKADIADECRIGPYAHVRPQSRLERKVRIGNFVETKAAHLREGVAAGHLTYLGDAEVGAGTNIGAGTITANFDYYTKQKHRTIIGAHTSISSHTTLVAPVTVADGAATAAGSVITYDVPEGALGIARERQTIKEEWVTAKQRAALSEAANSGEKGTQHG